MKLGLEARFTIFVSGLVLVVGVALTALILIVYRGAAAQRAAQVAQHEAREAGESAERALGAGDINGLSMELAAKKLDHYVALVRISDTDGRTLTSRGDPALIGGSALLEITRQQQRGHYRISKKVASAATPIKRDGVIIGYADVGVDRSSISEAGMQITLKMVALLLVILLIAITMTMVMVRRLTAPLRQLTDFAARASTQHLQERMDVKSGDEFEQLAEAFNALLGRFDGSMRRINRLAFTDTASGLPNLERFRREIARVAPLRDGRVRAVYVLRLQRLGHMQEAFGREAGEDLFALIAKRIVEALRTIDATLTEEMLSAQPAMLARLGATEFGVFAPSLRNNGASTRLAQLLSAEMNQAIEWRGQKLTLNPAIGVSLAPKDGTDADDLIRNAYLAVTAAGAQNDRLRHFTKSMDREATAELQLERAIREAIEGREIQAYFQPKVDLRTGAIIGAEALARWIRPDRSMISPGRFIPAAERNGLISEIAELMLRQSCWNAAAWRRRGLEVCVAVNVSPVQFVDESFADRILTILEQSGLEPSALELEITESVAMESPERATRLIAPLRSRGVRIALDDFGCGHSSLAALTKLPFDCIKIDQQFVRGLSQDEHSATIIETILAMAASLGFDVVAEGIETEQEAQFLRRRGCSIGQGFLFGAALPPGELLERMESGIQPPMRHAG
jgi:EAL domain-containing protein (putative c-di-GMP-specific phosphodiesterase class I)/GGDEF domain-containing protein